MKKILFLLLIVFSSFGLAGCGTTEQPPVDTGYTLTDLAGKTRTEIQVILEEQGIVVIFREIQTDDYTEGTFIRYSGYSIGDKVESGTTVRVEVAVKVPFAPVISGADDATVYVSVQGNPPTFDLWEGVTATDYRGNAVEPNGSFFYILSIKDELDNSLDDVNYYKLGDYTVTYQAQTGTLITVVERVISVVVPPFDTNHTDALRLGVSYAGKSFINDGIGLVTISSYTDGDTTNFRDSVTGIRFTVRYLGIDAPEATSKYDPWGIAAASFVRDTLDGAESIILQAEGERMDGNGRYLAWVWYVKNGVTRLLNLELVEQAYAWGSGAGTTQYGSDFTVAVAETQLTGKRIYGEVDPSYDYSTSGVPVTIGELLDNFEDFVAKQKVTVTGIITSKVGNSIFLESDGRGIYLYCGYTMTNELQVGYEVTIQGLLPQVYNDGKQLSNYKMSNMQLLSVDNIVTPNIINGSQIATYVGRLVKVENLTVVDISLNQSGSTTDPYTVVVEDEFNNTVNIRVDASVAPVVPSYTFSVGQLISVTAPVTQYYTSYQLMLPGMGSIQIL